MLCGDRFLAGPHRRPLRQRPDMWRQSPPAPPCRSPQARLTLVQRRQTVSRPPGRGPPRAFGPRRCSSSGWPRCSRCCLPGHRACQRGHCHERHAMNSNSSHSPRRNAIARSSPTGKPSSALRSLPRRIPRVRPWQPSWAVRSPVWQTSTWSTARPRRFTSQPIVSGSRAASWQIQQRFWSMLPTCSGCRPHPTPGRTGGPRAAQTRPPQTATGGPAHRPWPAQPGYSTGFRLLTGSSDLTRPRLFRQTLPACPAPPPSTVSQPARQPTRPSQDSAPPPAGRRRRRP